MKNKQPAIRFKGFTEDWKQYKLSEISKITMGQSPNSKNYTNNSEDYILVQGNSDIKNNHVVPKIWTKQITKTASIGDLIISVRAPVGEVGKSDYNVVIGRGVAAIKGNEFIFQALKKMNFNNYWKQFSAGSTFDAITSNDLILAVLLIPEEIEQMQIGSFLEQFDNFINLYQSKCDKLVNIKKSLLEKMFPKSDSNVPEIRFKGFTEDWEQHKLNVIADVRDGTHASPQYFLKGHPFVTSKNVKDGYINFDDIQYISDEDFKEINKRSKVDKNDILMGMIGTIGNIALVRKNPDFAIKNVALIKDTGNIYYLYLYYYLQSSNVSAQLAESIDGGTQKFIALNKIRDLTINVPNKDKQHRISKCFIQIDNLINLYQRKIEKLQNIKKFCLDKMFV